MKALLLVLAAFAAFAPAAHAEQLIATDGTNLYKFDSGALSTVTTTPVTGLVGGETLMGIDLRPATGELLGTTSGNRVYVINPTTGAAVQRGANGAFTLSGTDFGMDLDPAADRVRHVSNSEQNLRLNPNDGTLTLTDTPLNPGGDVVAVAYTNNFPNAAATTLYDIDWADQTLLRQGGPAGTPRPNGGTLSQVGPLMVAPQNPSVGFDIASDGTAYAAMTTLGFSRLYTINLETGAASEVGIIGSGGTPLRSLTVATITPPQARFTSADATAPEGADAIVEVARPGPATAPVGVSYSTAAGSAAPTEDFTPVSGTLSWTAGEAGPKTIAVPVLADPPAEGDETFTVTLSGPTGGAQLASPSTATVTIPANEAGPTLQFGTAAVAAGEGDTVSLAVVRVGSSAQAVSVGYASTPGSAGEDDYTLTTGTVSWPAGDGAPKTITIPIAADRRREGDERFTVALTDPAGGATLGMPAAARVTITGIPTLKLRGKKRQKLRTVRRKGVAIAATPGRACDLVATLRRGKNRVGRRRASLRAGTNRLRVKVKRPKDRRRLRPGQKLKVKATCTNAGGKSKAARRTVTLKR